MSEKSPVHVAPFLMLRDSLALLILAIGLNDWLRPDSAWVVEAFQFTYYTWVLLGVGGFLTIWTLISWVMLFRGAGLVASEDFRR